MGKKGDTVVYIYSNLEYLQGALRGRLTVHINRSKIDRNSTPLYFVAIEQPTFCNPSGQAKADLRILPNCRGNGLDEERLRLLKRLCTERTTAQEPELIVEEQLPPPLQIIEQHQQENEPPPHAAEVERRRPTRRRQVLQELQLQQLPELRARWWADDCDADEEPGIINGE